MSINETNQARTATVHLIGHQKALAVQVERWQVAILCLIGGLEREKRWKKIKISAGIAVLLNSDVEFKVLVQILSPKIALQTTFAYENSQTELNHLLSNCDATIFLNGSLSEKKIL